MKNIDIQELRKASEQLVEFVNKYCSPYDRIIIQQGQIELVNVEVGIKTEILD